MRVVGVSRVLNEADIIEPFIRHHAAVVDAHIVLDGGSTDATVDILRALHAEGLPLQVFQTISPIFVETLLNTGLYRLALDAGADWVMFLDADEFLVVREADRPEAVMQLVPADVTCLQLQVFRYAVPAADGTHPATRLRHRDVVPHMPKVAVRRLDRDRVSVYAGNHGAFIDGRPTPGLPQDRLLLAHVFERSPLQAARKAILGRMKAIASGAQSAAVFNEHYEPTYRALQADPRAWLEQQAATQGSAPVEDPVAYRGGPLRYTRPPDELARLIALLAAEGERLAQSHGAILDRKRLIRKEMLDKGAQARRLF